MALNQDGPIPAFLAFFGSFHHSDRNAGKYPGPVCYEYRPRPFSNAFERRSTLRDMPFLHEVSFSGFVSKVRD